MTYTPAPGDVITSRTLDPVDGFDLIAYEVYDTDSSPIGEETENGGCYDRADIEAWRNDEWYYAGVVVVASRAGIPLGSGAIWGCDTGDYWDRGDGTYSELLDVTTRPAGTYQTLSGPVARPAGVEFAHGYGDDLIAEALIEARATLARLGVSA
ncbi:hypothetical protein KNU02_gp88 [Gordonia phage Pleakley]|uniref:Uncharacterized protein n=1 Tax=Gordonia phage Pleakley TaxID=2283246 RepID=A0A345M6K6_9CAUD|nr:hypothetical protein KNU02_gp88 [Gordonia phage Pleakley]AXH49813.1 hypothetical protein SEA_FURY_88 [Gordonia phage Fury]AXH66127.1 hypothetical protein SEA_PLEAKLEY_88 [Gordonia phage Pleakley]